MHIFDNLLRRAVETPSATFCDFYAGGKHVHYTVGEIVALSIAVARRLREHCVEQGDVVPIVLDYRIELYTSFIGSTLCGAVPAFLPPLTQKQDPLVFATAMKALMSRLEPRVVVGSSVTLPLLAEVNAKKIDITGADAVIAGPITDPFENADHTTAFMQHSSGTTGLKKGVRLTHEQVMTQIAAYAEAISLNPKTDRVASWLPLYHDMGLITSFLMPAVVGIPIVNIDAIEWVIQPTMLLDIIERHGATLCWLPNFAFHHIARLARLDRHWDISSARMIVNCSEPCRASAFDVFLQRFSTCGIDARSLQVSFALAENVFAVTQTTPGALVRRSSVSAFADYLSCGRPIRGVEVRICDESECYLPDGNVGQILIRSDSLFAGYDKLPELTSQRLKNGYYHTGDIGFFEDGELFVVGRLDDVLNINGKKLIAHEVEATLNNIAGVAPGRVLVYENYDAASGASALLVAAELDVGSSENGSAVSADIRRQVLATSGMRPQAVKILPRGFLIKSTAGKISRKASIEKISSIPLDS